MINQKDNADKLIFIIPIILFGIGIYLLYNTTHNSEAISSKALQLNDSTYTVIENKIIKNKSDNKIDSTVTTTSKTTRIKASRNGSNTGSDTKPTKQNTPDAFQYFLLSSIIFIVLLLLPRLKELTLSKDSVSIVLQDTLQKVDDLIPRGQPERMREGAAVDVEAKVQIIKSNIELLKKMIVNK